MTNQLPIQRDFVHDGIQWLCALNRLKNNHFLQIVLKEMACGNEHDVRTAYFTAMDIIHHCPGEQILTFLQNGGITALKNLINCGSLQNRGWKSLGPALDIFEGLLKVNEAVRRYLLRYWDMLLRPVKRCFNQRRAFKEVDDNIYRLRRQGVKHLPRLMPNADACDFSEYLRSLETIIYSAPDSRNSLLRDIYLANKRLDPFHRTIKDLDLELSPKRPDVIYGPRIGIFQQVDEFDSSEIIPYLIKYFQYDEEISDEMMDSKESISTVEGRIQSPLEKCIDQIKPILHDSPEPEVIPKYCEEFDSLADFEDVRRLSSLIPSLVALTNRNSLLFPSVREEIDPRGELEDTVRRIMEPSLCEIVQDLTNPPPAEEKPSLLYQLRASRIGSGFGNDMAAIFAKAESPKASIKSKTSTEESSSTPQTVCGDKYSIDSSPHGLSRHSRDMSRNEYAPIDSLDMSSSSSSTESWETFSAYIDQSSFESLDDLVREIVRKTLLGLIGKPAPDMETEVVKMCQHLSQESTIDHLAEAVVERVLYRLKNQYSSMASDRILEEGLRKSIYDYLSEEAKEHNMRKSSKQRNGKDTTQQERTLPVLPNRKSVQFVSVKRNAEGGSKMPRIKSRVTLTKDPVHRLSFNEHIDRDSEQSDPIFPDIEIYSRRPPRSRSKGRKSGGLRIRISRNCIEFIEDGRPVRSIKNATPTSCQVLDRVLKKMAEQLADQLDAAQKEQRGKEASQRLQALFIVQRVISNLALQLSSESGDMLNKRDSVSEVGRIERQANSIIRKVISHPAIESIILTADLDLKQKAIHIVNNVVMGAMEEVSKNQNNSNQNGSYQKDNDDTPVPIIWHPSGVPLARAIRTGRLVI